jgi:hypothetical protein
MSPVMFEIANVVEWVPQTRPVVMLGQKDGGGVHSTHPDSQLKLS